MENFRSPEDEIHLLISDGGGEHLSVCLQARTQNVFARPKKKKIIGLHVGVDQGFLPSQSGPISWMLTCALTPVKGRIGEHGKTKSGKRKLSLTPRASPRRRLKVLLLSLSCCLCTRCHQELIQRLHGEVMDLFSVLQVVIKANRTINVCVRGLRERAD